MKLIEGKPYRGGWSVFETPGVEPFFIGPEAQHDAIDYAKTRQGFGRGDIRVIHAGGEVI